MVMQAKRIDDKSWGTAGDLVLGILDQVYRKRPRDYEREAKKRGITVDQLAAAAIAGAMREHMEDPHA